MAKIVGVDISRLEEDGSILVRLDTGKVLVALSEKIRPYADPDDETALPALCRALDNCPSLFRVVTRTAPVIVPLEDGAFTSGICPEDRARLRAITMKHWRKYFAERPTTIQLDQLIDAIGPGVAATIVKRAVDRGAVH